MNEDPRNFLSLMKETSYKTGTCEKLNRVMSSLRKGKRTDMWGGAGTETWRTTITLRTWVLQKAKCIPTAISFCSGSNFLSWRNHPSLRKKERRLQEVEWLVSHYNHGDGWEAETQASASKPKLSLCCVFTVFGLTIIGQTSFARDYHQPSIMH